MKKNDQNMGKSSMKKECTRSSVTLNQNIPDCTKIITKTTLNNTQNLSLKI